MLRPLWRVLVSMAMTLVVMALGTRAMAAEAEEPAMTFAKAPFSMRTATTEPVAAPEREVPSFDSTPYRCDNRGAFTIAPRVRLDAQGGSVKVAPARLHGDEASASDSCAGSRWVAGSRWEGPHEAPAAPPTTDGFGFLGSEFPRVAEAYCTGVVTFRDHGLGYALGARSSVERPPRA